MKIMMDDFLAFSSKAEDQQDEAGPAAERAAPALVTTTPPPWLIYNPTQYDLYAPPLIRLHNEILTCCEYIAPTMSELKHRDIVLNEITSIISLLWPLSKVHVFGSQMTKILTPTSDLDIAVLNVVDDRMDQSQLLYQLADKLKDSGLVSYVEAIVHAKVPIVKCDHRRSQLSVDICINNDSGIRTGQLIRKFVREYPPLRPLVLILKVFLVRLSITVMLASADCELICSLP
jgi:DNA polymerase sigma